MANRDLLKSAIAEAKSVKETAIANAKLALEEAFTPHLKSMLSAKLEEMDRDDEDEKEVKEADAPSFARKNSPAGDSLKNLSPRKVGQSTVQEDEEEEEINLDELLAELEKDSVAENARTRAEEGYKDGMKNKIKDLKEDERTNAEEEGYLDGEDEKEDMDDEEIDLEDMSEEDLKGFIEDVIKDMVAGGEIEPGDGFVEDEVDIDVDVEDVDVEDVDVEDVDVEDINEAGVQSGMGVSGGISRDNALIGPILTGLEKLSKAGHAGAKAAYAALQDAGRSAGMAMRAEANKEELDEKMTKKEKAEGDDRKKDDKIEAETEKMRFKEAMNEINALKIELQEVNLLNAKLLYTNKIFKAKNLTEDKKVKVLKAFDKALDVRQAKTIFETLSEGLINKSTNPTINESIKRGSSSKLIGLEPKVTRQPIIESNEVFDRMRKLAGLI
jgi:hypothetical protein